MREIKFRAWNESNKYMAYQGTPDLETISSFFFHYGNSILMQYTGLKDKNNKEIYEGDIIEFDEIEWGGKDNIHIVNWNNEDGKWCWGGGTTSDMKFRKVIGNIHENPELLK